MAAQDGYIGAQINTLNAVSSGAQHATENVTSAQNAVQATDYASATSNMSKYEILSQTGISALAQANSMQQEVTKLLQYQQTNQDTASRGGRPADALLSCPGMNCP